MAKLILRKTEGRCKNILTNAMSEMFGKSLRLRASNKEVEWMVVNNHP